MGNIKLKCDNCRKVTLLNASVLRKYYNQKVKLTCRNCSEKIKVHVTPEFLNKEKIDKGKDKIFYTHVKPNNEDVEIRHLAKLKVLPNEFTTDQVLELRLGENIVGRAASRDTSEKIGILTRDTLMSRTHLVVHVSQNEDQYEYTVKDAGSANGTMINGKEISEHDEIFISPNEIIEIGQTKLKLV